MAEDTAAGVTIRYHRTIVVVYVLIGELNRSGAFSNSTLTPYTAQNNVLPLL